MSVDHRWCRVFAVPLSASRSLFFLLSHIVAHSVDKDGGPLSLVGRLGERDSARGAELCDATAAVTWLCRSSGSLAGPVCDLTFVTAADCGEYISKNAAGSSGGREDSSQPLLLPCATTAQALSRSLGQWGWETGLAYMQNDSQSFSLSYRPRDKAQFNNNKLVSFLERWCTQFLRRAR